LTFFRWFDSGEGGGGDVGGGEGRRRATANKTNVSC